MGRFPPVPARTGCCARPAGTVTGKLTRTEIRGHPGSAARWAHGPSDYRKLARTVCHSDVTALATQNSAELAGHRPGPGWAVPGLRMGTVNLTHWELYTTVPVLRPCSTRPNSDRSRRLGLAGLLRFQQ